MHLPMSATGPRHGDQDEVAALRLFSSPQSMVNSDKVDSDQRLFFVFQLKDTQLEMLLRVCALRAVSLKTSGLVNR